jgi:transcriptional regulator GlxA family with amidase domain
VYRPTTITVRTALLDDAMRIMADEYATDLTLDNVARRIATSRRQLQRCFAEHGEGSFRECLARIRMDHAERLLMTTPLTIREIARRVGYRQPAQFAKAFARYKGAVPSEFRARRLPLAA